MIVKISDNKLSPRRVNYLCCEIIDSTWATCSTQFYGYSLISSWPIKWQHPFFLDGPGVGPELSGFGVLPPDPSFSEFLDFFLWEPTVWTFLRFPVLRTLRSGVEYNVSVIDFRDSEKAY